MTLPPDAAPDADPTPNVAHVITNDPITISIRHETDPSLPANHSLLTAYFGTHKIAAQVLTGSQAERIAASGLFDEPCLVALLLREGPEQLDGRLFAQLPASRLRAALRRMEQQAREASGNAWEAPSFEDGLDPAPDESADTTTTPDSAPDQPEMPMATFLLGHIVRFADQRRYPNDLAAEAGDLLFSLLHGAGTNANEIGRAHV